MTDARPVPPGPIPFRWGWVVLAVAAVAVLLAAGTRAAPGALLLGIQGDTGWSIGQISVAGAAGLLLLGIAGPVSAALIDRFGVRPVTTGALLLTAGSLAASALTRDLGLFVVLFGLLAGFGSGLAASALGPVVANRWFVRGRGLVVGVFGAAASAGQLVFFPALTVTAVAAGWRVAVLGLAGALALAAVPALLFLRERPSDVGERARGAASDAPPEPLRSEPGILRRAARTPEFWLLAGTFFVCGATSNGVVGQHFIAHAADHGFAPATAAGALALMGAFNFVGTLVSGWLTDRLDPRRLLLAYYAFRGVSLLYLPLLHDEVGMAGFAILFGLDYIATVPPTVALIADTFGRRNVGPLYGWVYFAHMLGAAIASLVAGVVRDEVGTYAAVFVGAGWLAVAAGVAALAIRRPARERVALPA